MGKSRQDSMTKAERKFEKKLHFYSKVRDTVAGLNAQKSITKKKKLRSQRKKLKPYDLSSLSEFLPELKAPWNPTPTEDFKLNCKSRKKLVLKEGKQLTAVLNHPAFQSDPLGAIHQHLQSTQPVEDKNLKKQASKNAGKKAKRKNSKASAGPQSMEC